MEKKPILNIPLRQWTMTATEWEKQNPILLKGQHGINSDTDKFKIGDGESPWSELSYANVTPEELAALLKEQNLSNGIHIGDTPPGNTNLLWLKPVGTLDSK